LLRPTGVQNIEHIGLSVLVPVLEGARNVPSDVEATGAALSLGTIDQEEFELSNFPRIIGILVDCWWASAGYDEKNVQ
jgi:hypothetical protein